MHNSTTSLSQHTQHKPIKTHYTWTTPNLDQKITDVCKQELNVAEDYVSCNYVSCNHNNTKFTLPL